MNFGTKKTAEKCQRKIKYLIDTYKDAKSWNKSQTGGHIRKSVFYDKIDRVLGTRDISTMKHVVEAGTSTASPSSLSANPPSDHGGSQPSTSGTPSPPESSVASSGTSGTGNEISDAGNQSGRSQQTVPERKEAHKEEESADRRRRRRRGSFHQEKPRIHRKARQKAHCVYGGYAAEPQQTIRNDGIFHGLSSGSHKG